jgi:ectoine hydroxylase-related dioxygenase (phytanoyl-CoA dioxygenase family)
MWTKLIDLDNWYTVPFGGGHERVASQKWHRDPEDLHVVKVFTYFSDVDEEAGPFQYIPGSTEGGPYGDLWRWTVTGETYPPQEALAERIPPSEHLTAEGPAGTVILCDTSGFHRGGFAKTKPRLSSYFTFVSPASLIAGRESRFFAVDWSSADGELSDAARFALT